MLDGVELGVGVGSLVVEVRVGSSCVNYSLELVLEPVVGVRVEVAEVAKVRVCNSDASHLDLS